GVRGRFGLLGGVRWLVGLPVVLVRGGRLRVVLQRVGVLRVVLGRALPLRAVLGGPVLTCAGPFLVVGHLSCPRRSSGPPADTGSPGEPVACPGSSSSSMISPVAVFAAGAR